MTAIQTSPDLVRRDGDQVEMPADLVIAVIEDSARRHTVKRIARTYPALTEELVAAVLIAHGHPRVKVMSDNVEALRPLGHDLVTFTISRTPDPALAGDSRGLIELAGAKPPTRIPGLTLTDDYAARAHDLGLGSELELIRQRLDALVAAITKAEHRRRLAAEVERRRAELAELEAELGHVCSTCGRTFDGASGLAIHRGRAHGDDPA